MQIIVLLLKWSDYIQIYMEHHNSIHNNPLRTSFCGKPSAITIEQDNFANIYYDVICIKYLSNAFKD